MSSTHLSKRFQAEIQVEFVLLRVSAQRESLTVLGGRDTIPE